MKKSSFLLFVIALILASCKTQDKKTISKVNNSLNPVFIEVDSIAQMNHLKKMSSDEFMGRATGTKGGEISKDYIAKVYNDLSLEKLGNSYFQTFNFSGNVHYGKQISNYAHNVLGFIKGSETPQKVIVVGAHYDHLGKKGDRIYNGADDNASGTVALFSVIKYFTENPPKKSIVIAAWDAEEIGLQGSRYYVDNSIVPRYNIICNVNMDMIGRNDDNELYISGSRHNEILRNKVIPNLYTDKLTILTGHDGEDGLQDWTYSSDHAPFFEKGIPFLYFGVEDHKDYHKASDDFSKIHSGFYIEATRIVIQAIKSIDDNM